MGKRTSNIGDIDIHYERFLSGGRWTENYNMQGKKTQPGLWPVWLRWLEHHPISWKVASSKPGQGTYLGFRFDPQSGCIQEAMDQCLSLFPLPFPFLFSLKAMKKCPQMRIKKKKKGVDPKWGRRPISMQSIATNCLHYSLVVTWIIPGLICHVSKEETRFNVWFLSCIFSE